MADANTTRRVAYLKSRDAYSMLEEPKLERAILEAFDTLKQHTSIMDDLGEELDTLLIDIASARLNLEGVEGMSALSENGVSISADVWNADLERRTWQYRTVLGL